MLQDLLDGFCDVHCHLLPCVDDGAESPGCSAGLLSELEQRGVKRIFLTPHIISDIYPDNNASSLKAAFAGLENRTKIELRLAAEYFLDEAFVSGLDSADGLLTYDGRNILVETWTTAQANNFDNALYEVAVRGYTPVIAHPERYPFMFGRLQEAESLCDKGYRLQVNLLSLSGRYGPVIQKTAREILEAGFYSFVATDLHSTRHMEALKTSSVLRKEADLIETLKENNHTLWV